MNADGGEIGFPRRAGVSPRNGFISTSAGQSRRARPALAYAPRRWLQNRSPRVRSRGGGAPPKVSFSTETRCSLPGDSGKFLEPR